MLSLNFIYSRIQMSVASIISRCNLIKDKYAPVKYIWGNFRHLERNERACDKKSCFTDTIGSFFISFVALLVSFYDSCLFRSEFLFHYLLALLYYRIGVLSHVHISMLEERTWNGNRLKETYLSEPSGRYPEREISQLCLPCAYQFWKSYLN